MLTSREVAVMFRVARKTVYRWTVDGKLSPVMTPGGRLRYRESDVRALLTPETAGPADPDFPPTGAGPVPQDG